MFADLNKHAVRPTKSLSVLYDHRDDMASLAVKLAQNVPVFKGLTDMEKTSISNRSICLFTLNAIFQATQALLGKRKKDEISREEAELAHTFWVRVGEVIPEWRLVIRRKVSAAELRKNYVHSHGVALQALGEAGADLIGFYPDDWDQRLKCLEQIDWRRTNTELWEGRAMRRGKMSKANDNVGLTVNVIKMVLSLPLTEKQLELETLLKGEVKV
jgi:DNA sulfur modification protein DndB